MGKRLVALLWLALGVAIWNGFFDLYVSRGAREYGQLRVEAARDHLPEPSMKEVMGRAKRDGAIAASVWAVLVVGGGLGTLWMSQRRTVPRS